MKKILKILKNRVEIIVVKNKATGKDVPLSIVTELYDDGSFKVTCLHYNNRQGHLESWKPLQNLSHETYGDVQKDMLEAIKSDVKQMTEEQLNTFESELPSSGSGHKLGIRSHPLREATI